MAKKAPLLKGLVTRMLLIPILLALLGSSAAWAGKGNGSGVTSLDNDEAAILAFMAEEEKLARDVYLALFEVWGAEIFSSIALSEQQHMDTMAGKVDKYNLPDPVLPSSGVFTDPGLQEKYDLLVASGVQSYIDGLYAGATIEEIDMVDIQYAIDITSHLDVVTAYQNLLEGSKNHLRAYVGSLKAQGIDYAPQYLSQELFDAIIGL